MIRRSRRAAWIAGLLVIALTLRLGFWQLDRARQKQALVDRVTERAALPPLPLSELRAPTLQEPQIERRTVLEGRWLPERTVFLDNRQMAGSPQPGFLVLTPLELAPGDVVLVQRGWAPRNLRDRTQLPDAALPPGRWRVEGRVAAGPARTLAMGEGDPPGAVLRQNLDLDAWGRETGLALRPWTLRQTEPMQASAATAPAASAVAFDDNRLRRRWPLPAADISKHHGYAFQWFALAALTLGMLLWYQRPRPARPDPT